MKYFEEIEDFITELILNRPSIIILFVLNFGKCVSQIGRNYLHNPDSLLR